MIVFVCVKYRFIWAPPADRSGPGCALIRRWR